MKDRQRNRRQEECLLRFQETGDQNALQYLVESLEGKIKQQVGRAMRWCGQRVDREDLLSVGRLAVVNAAQKHDPSRGVPFRLYAIMYICGDIYEYGTRNSMDVSFSNSRKERKVQRMIFGLVAEGEAAGMTREQAVVTASRYLNITEEHAAKAMSIRYSKPIDMNDDETAVCPASGEPPVDEVLDDDKVADVIAELLAQLDEEERDIVVSYRYAEQTESLDSIAQRHGCSRDRIKRIEVQAMRWMALTLKERGLELGDLV